MVLYTVVSKIGGWLDGHCWRTYMLCRRYSHFSPHRTAWKVPTVANDRLYRWT